MAEDREQRGPAVAPGEPDAPAEGAEPSPAPDAVPSEELSEDQGGVADEERPHEPEEDERQLERDIEELTAKAEKADEYLELAKRTKADFENYRARRRARRSGASRSSPRSCSRRSTISTGRSPLPSQQVMATTTSRLGSSSSTPG